MATGDSSPPDNLTSMTLRGLTWTYTSTAVTTALQLIYTSVMSRLLQPRAFGLLAMALLVLNITNHFARMGLGQALVQKRELSVQEVRAAFTSSVLLGAIVSALVWLGAPLPAELFEEPRVVPILRVMGLGLLIAGSTITAESLMRRDIRFRELAYRDVVSYAVGYLIIGIGFAAAGAGVWSLVAATLSQGLVKSLICYLSTRHAIRPIFAWSAYRSLYGFGSQVSVIGVFEYIGVNLDVFMVGRYATLALLGQYNRALLLINLPLNHLMTGLSKVLFPSLSRIQGETARVRGAYLSAISASAALFLPLVAGMGVAANEIVLVVLGEQWTKVAQILPILAVAGGFKVLTHIAAVLCEAQAELRKKLVVQVAFVIALGVMLTQAIGLDLRWYAAAFATGKLLQHLGYMYLMRSILKIRFQDYRKVYGRGIIGAAFTAAAVAVVRAGAGLIGATLLVTFAAEVLTGALSLLALLRYGPLRPLGLDLLVRVRRAGATERSPAAYRLAGYILNDDA